MEKNKYKLHDDMGNNLLSDIRFDGLMDNMIQKISEDINRKRNDIITKRIREVVGIDLDLAEEARRRFKRFSIECSENTETIYFNDGSVDGKKIVTFVKTQITPAFKDGNYEMSLEYHYH